jgi:4-amino-4-deoxy-L-arabinose transferase-like glycosyltransferase
LPGLAAVVVAGCAAGYICAFVLLALLRLGYTFPLEFTEPGSLAELERVLRGQTLYAAPALDYVPMIYGPVFFYVSAPFALLTGPGLMPIRLLSVLASIGSMALIFRLVQRETHSLVGALVAAGLFAACNPLAENTMDLGRVDSLFTFLILAALFLARGAQLSGPRGGWILALIGGICMGLAAFTKLPIAAAPIALAILLGLALTARRQAAAFALGGLGCVAVILVLLRAQTGPWATWYLWDLPRTHVIGRELLGRFWFQDVLPRFGVALLIGPVALIAWVARRQWPAAVLYGLTLTSMILVSWASRAGGGGSGNTLLPAYAAIAILAGLGLAETLRLLQVNSQAALIFSAYVLVAFVVEFGLLAYDPRTLFPYRTDRTADEQLAAAIATLPGPVFAPEFAGYLTPEQGPQPFLGAVEELQGLFSAGRRPPEGDQWEQALAQALHERRFRYVLVDVTDMPLKHLVEADGYVSRGPLIPESSNFYAWRTPRTPQADVYVPPDQGHAADEDT